VAGCGVGGGQGRAGDRQDGESGAFQTAAGQHHRTGLGRDEAKRGAEGHDRQGGHHQDEGAAPGDGAPDGHRQQDPEDREDRHEASGQHTAVAVVVQQDRQYHRKFELAEGGKYHQREAKGDQGCPGLLRLFHRISPPAAAR
jgi:hypothetical protein